MSSIIQSYATEVSGVVYRPSDGKFYNESTGLYESLSAGAFPDDNVLASVQVLNAPLWRITVPVGAGTAWILIVYPSVAPNSVDTALATHLPSDLSFSPITQLLRKVPDNFVWQLPRRHDGAITSLNQITLFEGETDTFVGFDCKPLLSEGDILTAMNPPGTYNLIGVTVRTDIGWYGFDARYAKVYVSSSQISAQRNGYITAEVSTSNGGPYYLAGSVKIVPRS